MMLHEVATRARAVLRHEVATRARAVLRHEVATRARAVLRHLGLVLGTVAAPPEPAASGPSG